MNEKIIDIKDLQTKAKIEKLMKEKNIGFHRAVAMLQFEEQSNKDKE